MSNTVNEIKNLALSQKPHLMYKSIQLSDNDINYQLQIRGVGKKAIKLELYLDYERISNLKDDGTIEKQLWEKLNTIHHKEPTMRYK